MNKITIFKNFLESVSSINNSVTDSILEATDVIFSGGQIEGGLADGMSAEDIAEKHQASVEKIDEQLVKGIEVEMEHTNDEDIAMEIALDHLYEIADYYDRLHEMEEEAEEGEEESEECEKSEEKESEDDDESDDEKEESEDESDDED